MKVGQCRPVCGHGLISWRQEADVSDTLSRVTVQRCCLSTVGLELQFSIVSSLCATRHFP
jgi:hypothetical protein